jgi:uncharacterized protein (TIGR02600 family)
MRLRHPAKPNSGVALILVLMLVVLMTIMILAFFLSVQTETKSVHSVVAGQNSRELADIAVQSVISQIQQATTQPQGTTIAWASQPGMIRTYNNSGTALGWYKLYSAPLTNMVVTNPSESLNSVQQDLPTGGWATASSANYGVYTDINSPVYSADGTLTYPIVNPAGATSIAAATNAILGYDIATASTPGYSSTTANGPVNNPAAMPVRWLYVLQNGALATPVSSVSGTVTFDSSDPTKLPTASNPIVGRIAYWTDDETCKLNVNTAANGTYFDTPRFRTAYGVGNSTQSGMSGAARDAQRLLDMQMAISPPVANEYQRYIGQPAQTRLSYAFPGSPATAIGAQDLGSLSQIFSGLSPFMQWGGSEAGLYAFTDAVPPLLPPQRQTPYATLDEWMFSTELNTSTPATRLLNEDLNSNPIVTNTSLQQLRFFLSANSEGPEVNLFGQPRISIWPINNDYNPVTNPNSPKVTTTDKLIANASTLFPTSGGTTTAYPYYFTRSQANSCIYDYSSIARNKTIYQYLQTLAGKAIPGYGGKFTTKYGAPETYQILTEIFDYIRCTDPSDTLLLGSGAGTPSNYQYAQQTARSVHGQDGAYTAGGASSWAGAGQVMPIVIQPTGANCYTKGFGRMYGINEISMDFTQPQASTDTDTNTLPGTEIVTGVIYLNLYCPALGPPDLIPNIRIEIDGLRDSTGSLTITTTLSGTTTAPQPIFPLVTSGGSTRQVFSVVNEGLGTLFASDGWNDGGWFDFIWGGCVGPRQLTVNKHASYQPVAAALSTATMTMPAANTGNYMFCGVPIKIPKGSTINFSGGPLKIIISQADYASATNDPAYSTSTGTGDGFPAASADIMQTITVNFPAFSVPAPTNPTSFTDPSTGNVSQWPLDYRIYSSNYAPGNYTSSAPILNNDSIRSLISGYNGDSRLLAAQYNVTGTSTATTTAGVTADTMTQPFVFLPPTTPTTQSMHTQRDLFANNYFQMYGFTSPGSLLSAVTYGSTFGAYQTVNGYIGDHTSTGNAAKSPDGNGDFDNGLGAFPDGPYINKADEAEYQYASWASPSPIPYYTGGDSGNATYAAGGTALTYISPNRTVASPVAFGSLSTGVPMFSTTGAQLSPPVPPVPWRTLLFRPQPTHFGATSPEDELLLDWFWMPVGEPYSISTTFATSGKVNLNYQIAPFTYITRATALMGVLGSEYVITVPNSAAPTYKNPNTSTNPTVPYRQPIRLVGSDGRTIDYSTGTLGQFNQRFTNGQIFKSAAEICDINLVPNPTPTASTGAFDPTSSSAVASYWAANALTGDNSRERPYNGLYPRLTTKSNTYTVHVRAQTLTTPPTTPVGQWVENPRLISSEYRGSVTINRYIDPQDPNFLNKDFVASPLTYSLDNYYKYRILETRRFLP